MYALQGNMVQLSMQPFALIVPLESLLSLVLIACHVPRAVILQSSLLLCALNVSGHRLGLRAQSLLKTAPFARLATLETSLQLLVLHVPLVLRLTVLGLRKCHLLTQDTIELMT
jgi:hypothetical protein